jgi:endonuclease/exonuclease/phosphatase (EEP) superfamily protein YafD
MANTKRRGININQQISIRCLQINLQHSKVATDNLMKLTQQEHTDIVFVQEPYLFQNNTVRITRTQRIYAPNEENYCTTIIIANNNIDAVFIKQLSDIDTGVIEICGVSGKFPNVSHKNFPVLP